MAKRPLLYWLIYISSIAFRQGLQNVQVSVLCLGTQAAVCSRACFVQAWFLGYWATQYEIHPPEEVNVALYVLFFGPYQVRCR